MKRVATYTFREALRDFYLMCLSPIVCVKFLAAVFQVESQLRVFVEAPLSEDATSTLVRFVKFSKTISLVTFKANNIRLFSVKICPYL